MVILDEERSILFYADSLSWKAKSIQKVGDMEHSSIELFIVIILMLDAR